MHDEAVASAYERWLLQLAQSTRADASQLSRKPLCLFPLDPSTSAFLASYAPETRLSDELAASHFGTVLRLCAAFRSGNEELIELLQCVLPAIDTEAATIEDLQVLLCCCAVAPASFLQQHGFESIAGMLLRILDQPPSSLVSAWISCMN